MNDQSFEFILKTHAYFGEGEALKLPFYIKNMNVERVGIIIDHAVIKLPYIKKIISALKRAKLKRIEIIKYDIKEEPNYDFLDEIKLSLQTRGKNLVDCFVGIGGGSVIDVAKGLAVLMTNPGTSINYRGFPVLKKIPLPVIAIPTVAGSGSEATYNASFIDWKEKRKMGINTILNFPACAILDPLISVSCPMPITIASGMDALVHAIESWSSTKKNAISAIFSEVAFRYVCEGLSCLHKPSKTESRLNLHIGAYLAGVAIINSGGGPASVLSYPLGVHARIPHGLAGAACITFVVDHNINKGYDYSTLYDLIAPQKRSLSKRRKNNAFAKMIKNLYTTLKIGDQLKRFTFSEETSKKIIMDIYSMKESFKLNPVPFTPKDGVSIFKKIGLCNPNY